MGNNTRTQADGTWVDGYEPPESDWTDLERKIFGSWNGDKGGVYVPPAGAAGTLWNFQGAGLKVTGPTRLTYGGQIWGSTATSFVIQNDTWPMLGETHSARVRAIVCPIHAIAIPPVSRSTLSTSIARYYMWSRYHPYGGVGSVALALKEVFSRDVQTPEFYAKIRTIDGAELLRVTLYFRVATKRIFAPIAMPKLRILRVPKDSGGSFGTVLPEPLKNTADGLGFDFLPLVATPDAWYADGEVQSFVYECDQNNVIDTENYDYFAHLVEETGFASVDDPYDGVRLAELKQAADYWCVNTATLSGSVSTDGSSTATGNRILVVDPDDVLVTGEASVNSSKNGIWIADNGGAWTRATDADAADDFSPNWLIRISAGAMNGHSYWQCTFPSSSQRVELTTGIALDASKSAPRIVPAEPKGNIYHSLVPEYGLEDLRFQ